MPPAGRFVIVVDAGAGEIMLGSFGKWLPAIVAAVVGAVALGPAPLAQAQGLTVTLDCAADAQSPDGYVVHDLVAAPGDSIDVVWVNCDTGPFTEVPGEVEHRDAGPGVLEILPGASGKTYEGTIGSDA